MTKPRRKAGASRTEVDIQTKPPPPRAATGQRALVVDDEYEMRYLTRLFLQHAFPGLEVREAETGQQGLDLLRRLDFDVVVSDHRMSGMDGAAFLREACMVVPPAKCILMTAYADRRLRERAQEAGWGFVEKGGDPTDIVAAVEAVLQQWASTVSQ